MMGRFKWMVLVLLLITWVFLVHAGTSRAAPAESVPAGAGSVETQDTAGYLENISFEKAGQKERVTLILSKQSGVQVDYQVPNAVVVTLQNLFIPQDLRTPLGEGALNNVLRAVASQKSTSGSPVALIRIDLKGKVPYSVKQVGNDVVLDFNLAAADIKVQEVMMQENKTAAAAPASTGKQILQPGSQPDQKIAVRQNGDEKLTINLQDATVKETLELLATRRPDLSIISTDDVDLKGKITIHIKNVTWGKALDTILKLKGLAKQQDENVILISTVQKMREDEAERKKTIEELKKQQQEDMVTKGKLRQVSIEAKIIEADEGFVRNLGVQWAYGSTTHILSNQYPLGILAGTNTTGILNTSTITPSLTTLPTGVALTTGALAVNFPPAVNPTLGVVVGSQNSVFSAQLSALETTSDAKIISSPKVVTMDGEVASIEQGEEIPVVTPASANQAATTTYKKAVLALKVKPIITAENRISMELSANNDRADFADKDPVTGNIPIFTNKIDSKVVINDGDTIVIGGIHKSDDEKSINGVPWLSHIPVFGWLFKTENITRTNQEIYIVVTPRIIKNAELTGQ